MPTGLSNCDTDNRGADFHIRAGRASSNSWALVGGQLPYWATPLPTIMFRYGATHAGLYHEVRPYLFGRDACADYETILSRQPSRPCSTLKIVVKIPATA